MTSSSGGGGLSNRSSSVLQEASAARKRNSVDVVGPVDVRAKSAKIKKVDKVEANSQSPTTTTVNEVEGEDEDMMQEQEESGAKDEEVKTDPIVGRYRMVSSEGFDDFMKALGVGMVKRKMANSVTPVNVVEIDNDGVYTIRTETTLRTSEIRFELDKPFPETTLDGRVTKTTATRSGDVIRLEQAGKAGEKDSTMTRDFRGDTMLMELTVDDVVCKRVYHRITE